ncbi:chaperonin 10-like protein [Mycena vulgaris]|nr:chaperonin 10-like protein [Mycena vulgaris]
MAIEFTTFKGSDQGIVQATSRLDGPTGNQVLVEITHSGICGTDEQFKHSDMVLGHEGVGTVSELGDSVTGLQIGDVVGWGYTHKTCGTCEECLLGKNQYCPTREQYGVHNLHQGSFGSHAVWDASFLFKIPEGLAPEDAAPLMCGGATVYGVIESYNIRPFDRVGVVGIGGLGHIAELGWTAASTVEGLSPLRQVVSESCHVLLARVGLRLYSTATAITSYRFL